MAKQLVYKWPVVLWEVVDYDAALVAQARQLEFDYLDEATGEHAKAQDRWKFPKADYPRLAAELSTIMPRIALPG